MAHGGGGRLFGHARNDGPIGRLTQAVVGRGELAVDRHRLFEHLDRRTEFARTKELFTLEIASR